MNCGHLDQLWNLNFHVSMGGPAWKRFCHHIIIFQMSSNKYFLHQFFSEVWLVSHKIQKHKEDCDPSLNCSAVLLPEGFLNHFLIDHMCYCWESLRFFLKKILQYWCLCLFRSCQRFPIFSVCFDQKKIIESTINLLVNFTCIRQHC